MKAMVLAAGFGTRLRPLTNRRPKPLVPFGDGHSLERAVTMLRQAGATKVVVNAHHLAEQVQAWAAAEAQVEVSVEHAILGTAGGVAAASTLLGDGDVVVMNGDIMAAMDLALLQAKGRQGDGALAVLGHGPMRAAGLGTVGLCAQGRVVRLRDFRGREAETCSADFVGTQWIAGAARGFLPEQGCLVGDFYMPLLRAGRWLATAEICDGFFDVGTLGDYLAAQRSWLGTRQAWCGAGVQVEAGVHLEKSVVGAGARIQGSGRLEGCVVWPGAVATAPLRHCIVLDDASVVSLDGAI